jgi:hypothetical protein
MYHIACPNCAASFEYNPSDYIHLCTYCSSGFALDLEDGAKDLVGDHYIVPNRLDREHVSDIFFKWVEERYHRKEAIKEEFKVLGSYGVCLPFWVISCEAHTVWSGQTQKSEHSKVKSGDYGSRFVHEDGRFSRRYRWAVMARKSPKEHWGLDRLHHPREPVLVDWDGFPLDESMGKVPGTDTTVHHQKVPFRFDHANGLSVLGTQVKESASIARAKDQVQEYHRRLAKLKVGTLYDHRTEIEVIGIQLVHVPFWVVRYAYSPRSPFRYLTAARERRVLIQGFTEAVLESELPMNATDKVMTNLIVTGALSFVSLALSVFLHPLFFVLFVVFALISVLSAIRIFRREDLVDAEPANGVGGGA